MEKEKKDLSKLVDIISGEKALREQNEKLMEEKKKAIQLQKEKQRKGIVKGNIKIEKGEDVPKRDVVQNIKLFEWKAPDRYEFKFNSKGFLIILSLSLVFVLLLAILEHYFMMAAVISMLFLIYVAGTTKPLIVKHKITARGLDTGGKLYEWYVLEDFYFTKKENALLMIMDTRLNVPGLLIFIIDEKDKDAIFVLLQEHLLYKDIRKQGWLDRASYGEYIPLEQV